ncbi:MAG: STAS domain-containing protein [Azoarcus sp.]|jgi:phospholipid transport system transporter-binding protein|nr:STAS domain-containing protein [Azoarcus sp.]
MTEPACVKLEGVLMLDTVTACFAQPLPEGDSGSDGRLIIDLSGVTRVDSSALALLLAWLRQASIRIELRAMPESLLALARLYGVDALLPGVALTF